MARGVDLRPKLGDARSQGYLRSTCLAFAASAAHEIALFDDNDIVDTSEEYLYWASKEHDTPGPGTTFPAVRDAFATRGQPLESVWPYDEARDDQAASYRPPARAHVAQPRWAPAFSAIPATPNSVCAELDQGRAVVLGLPTWPDLDLPVNGHLVVPDLSDLDGDHHAVALVGYDEATSEMLIRNSWGLTWGDTGSAWLPLQFLDVHVCETWIVGAAALVAVAASTASAARYGSPGRRLDGPR